jgi:4a-hydroxytetrahydrobiopterin dehydratase
MLENDRLNNENCVPCRGGEPVLQDAEIERFQRQVPEWNVIEVQGEKRLERIFKFKDFAQALEFTDQIGRLAEQQGHHPALLTEWGKVTVWWWTHKIHGLHRNDFVMASKSDAQYHPGSGS